jgi:asparagine synthase (glutamine-hydrolysing)
MCGLAGFFSLNRLPSNADRIGRQMLTLLAHRGPDGSNLVVDEASCAVSGHVRLAINGFKRMRALLAADGERFASRSDSEVLLGMYRRHGVDFCDHIRGEFAVVIHDRAADRIVLTRDRFGVRPLYYYLDEQHLVWASEVKALLVHPAVPRRMSVQAAVNQLAQVMVPGSSAFDRIQAVQPGCQVVIQRASGRLRLSQRRYWDIMFQQSEEPSPQRIDDHIDAVRQAVIDSVLTRTETDAPLGVYLSGGLDSTIVLGVAAEVMQRLPSAVSLSFAHEDYDEAGAAKESANYYGVPLSIRSVDHGDLYGTASERSTTP